MKKTFFIMGVFTLIATHFCFAQNDSAMLVHKDYRLDILLKKQADINATAAFRTSNGQYKGFRIMVLNTNDRELAYKTKGQLLSRFPDESVYMSYQAPFFKLKIGDFIKKEDAEDLRKTLSNMMPKGVFVVPDVIKIKPSDLEKMLNMIEEKN